jgi:hypothetical protein
VLLNIISIFAGTNGRSLIPAQVYPTGLTQRPYPRVNRLSIQNTEALRLHQVEPYLRRSQEKPSNWRTITQGEKALLARMHRRPQQIAHEFSGLRLQRDTPEPTGEDKELGEVRERLTAAIGNQNPHHRCPDTERNHRGF